MLGPEDIQEVIDKVDYHNWEITYFPIYQPEFAYLLRLRFKRTDTVTGDYGYCAGMRGWYIEAWRDKTYVLRTIFMMMQTTVEHEFREEFQYEEKAIFGPHAQHLEVR